MSKLKGKAVESIEDHLAHNSRRAKDFVYKEVVGEEEIFGAVFRKGTNVKLKHVTSPEGKIYKLLEIPNKYKLGDVLLQLPFGIVDKQITGIGATYLELKADRNSIIIEPLKAIAYSKAKEGISLYVGSPIGTQKVTTKKTQIIDYLNDDNIKPKKLLVVANSLKTVIEVVGEDIYNDFFIMIDEVDSFQADSNFRDSMELCLDEYKKFPFNKRCLVTATMLTFSDPYLMNEHFLEINYKTKETRKLELINTNTLLSTVASKINELYQSNIKAKIVVAYNSVDGCLKIIKILDKKYSIKSDENNPKLIRLMCSKSNKKTAGKYYDDILNEELPGPINFLTSAYFTGVDINEDFHIISVSDGNIPYTLLSDHKLKQIAGRCRTQNLLSETVIYTHFKGSREPYEKLDETELIHLAQVQKKAAKCFESQYKEEPVLREELVEFRKALVKSQNFKGLNFIRVDAQDKTEVSYFNIDASKEWTRVKFDLYHDPQSLFLKLQADGHDVSYQKLNVDIDLADLTETDEAKAIAFEEALKNLEELNENNKKELNDLIYDCGSPIQERTYGYFIDLRKYFTKEIAIEKLRKLSPIKDNRAFKNFFASLVFLSQPNSNPIKQAFTNTFNVGSYFTDVEIKQEIGKINSRLFLDELLNPAVDYGIAYLNLFFDVKLRRNRRVMPEIRDFKILGLHNINEL